MDFKQNLHMHTTFCDGNNTVEEIAKAAIEKGFFSIGFSGHSYTSFSKYGMQTENIPLYKAAVNEAKKKYADKLNIFCGVEFEMYSEEDISDYEYVIGSCHYFNFDGNLVGFDRGQTDVENVINDYFGGDGMAYAKKYYQTLAQLPNYANVDIIGHFDLITKHSDNIKFFDEDSKEYLNAAFEAAESLAGKIPYFEVNTGAIARGYRKTPYPSIPILRELKRLGFGVVVSSDCHNKDFLDCYFDESIELLKYVGFNERYVLTNDGFKAVKL